MPKSQNKVIFKITSPQLMQSLKKSLYFLLVPLHFDLSSLLNSFLVYKATAHHLISPAKLPRPLICLVHLSWTFSFFNRQNSNILTGSLSFSENIRSPSHLSPDVKAFQVLLPDCRPLTDNPIEQMYYDRKSLISSPAVSKTPLMDQN